MTNMHLSVQDAEGPARQVIQKPILTTAEAAEMLGLSRRKLRQLDIPRHALSVRIEFYLTSELVEWVRQLPQYGEMPRDGMSVHTQIVVV